MVATCFGLGWVEAQSEASTTATSSPDLPVLSVEDRCLREGIELEVAHLVLWAEGVDLLPSAQRFEGVCFERDGWVLRMPHLSIEAGVARAEDVALFRHGMHGEIKQLTMLEGEFELWGATLFLEPGVSLEGVPAYLQNAPGGMRLTAERGMLRRDGTLALEQPDVWRFEGSGEPIERLAAEGAVVMGDRVVAMGLWLGRAQLLAHVSEMRFDAQGLEAFGVKISLSRDAFQEALLLFSDQAKLTPEGELELIEVRPSIFGWRLPFSWSSLVLDLRSGLEWPWRFGLEDGGVLGVDGWKPLRDLDVRFTLLLRQLFADPQLTFSFAGTIRTPPFVSSLGITALQNEPVRFRLAADPASGPTYLFRVDFGRMFDGSPKGDAGEELAFGWAHQLEVKSSFASLQVRAQLELGQAWQPEVAVPEAMSETSFRGALSREPRNSSQSLLFAQTDLQIQPRFTVEAFSFEAKVQLLASLYSAPEAPFALALLTDSQLRYTVGHLRLGLRLQLNQALVIGPLRAHGPEELTRASFFLHYQSDASQPSLGFAGLWLSKPHFVFNLERDLRTDEAEALRRWRVAAADLGFQLAWYGGETLRDPLDRAFQQPRWTLAPALRLDLASTVRGYRFVELGAEIGVDLNGLILQLGVFREWKTYEDERLESGMRFTFGLGLR